jgi:predicted RNA-binding Zn ribbon-like protein
MKKVRFTVKMAAMVAFASATMMSCGGGEEATDALNDMLNDIESAEAGSETETADAPETETTEAVVEVEATETEGNTAEVDAMLDSYEVFADEYAVVYKKMLAGDTDATTEYAALMQKASEWQVGFASAQGEGAWGPEQVQRMMDIQTKLANVALQN